MTEIHSYLEALMLTDDRPLRLHAGQVLFTQGQPSDGRMFVVREGTIELRVGRRWLETVGPGGIVGEMALIDPAARSATAAAGLDGCLAAAVTEHTFHELVKRVPGIALELMRIMARRLRRTTARHDADEAKPARRKTKRGARKPAAKPARRRR